MICTMFNTEPKAPRVAPHEVMANLAMRLRPGGLFLALADEQGVMDWCDTEAAPFFQRYVRPLLNPACSIGADESTQPAFQTGISRHIPGVLVCAVVWSERGRRRGTLILVGRDHDFTLNEDVRRMCSHLDLETLWLRQEAEALPGVSEQGIRNNARLALDMLHDQLRLTSFEGEMDNLSSQLAATYEELMLIYHVSSGMQINRTAGEFFKQTCGQVMEVLGVQGLGIALDGATGHSSAPTLYGRKELPPEVLSRLGDLLLNRLPRREDPLLVNDLSAHGDLAWLPPHARQLLVVPLIRQDKHLGCMFALDKDDGEFDSTDAKLLASIANEVSVYLENSRLFGDVHGLMMGLLHSLTSAVDAKDAYTCGHSERVALLSRALAQKIGLNDNQVERVYMAGLLHDVGKIGISEAVLRKSGKLTDDEYEEVKRHPDIGVRILQDIKQIADLLPGVMHHHERYDGRGYPAGLSGQAIPLMGRIICLADCFDAMTSSRTYRKAMPMETALAEIRRCAGTQFDPELAEAFLTIPVAQFRKMLHDHHSQCRPLLEAIARSAA